jgi:hypothetical protein
MNYCPRCGLPIGFPMNYTGMLCSCEETITTNSTTMSQQYYIFTDGKDVFVTDKIEPPLSSNSEDARKEFLSKSVRVENATVRGDKICVFDVWKVLVGGTEVNHLYPLEADRWRVEYGHYAVLGEKTDLGYKLTGSERTATILPVSQPQEFTCGKCGEEINEGEAKVFGVCDSCWDKHWSQPVVTKGEVSEEELARELSSGQYNWIMSKEDVSESLSTARHLLSRYTITPKE